MTSYVSMVFRRASLLGISSCPEIICSRLRRIISHKDCAALVCFYKMHKQWINSRACIVGKNCITISSASVSRYRDIVGCRQTGDGPAQQRDEDTGVDDSCCRLFHLMPLQHCTQPQQAAKGSDLAMPQSITCHMPRGTQ